MKARDLLKMYCAERNITYDEGIERLVKSSGKLDLDERSVNLLMLLCKSRKMRQSEAIIALIKKEFNEIATIHTIDNDGNITERVEERVV
jgi:hypothetical protein